MGMGEVTPCITIGRVIFPNSRLQKEAISVKNVHIIKDELAHCLSLK